MLLTIAMVFITAALVLYTVGVWAERISGRLERWHAVVFWLGLASDTTGTGAMAEMAGGLFQSTIHGLTGLLAILLMLFHAAWATWVLARRDEAMIVRFHRFSLGVWLLWLVPMIGGMVLGHHV
jgi:uncharacterized repeat protein (TIGR03987 family)